MTTVPCHLKNGDKVAVFGRMAFHYYKSGLGSGGLVNTRYVVGILDALRACKDIALDEELIWDLRKMGSKTIHMTKVRDGGWFRGHRKKCP